MDMSSCPVPPNDMARRTAFSSLRVWLDELLTPLKFVKGVKRTAEIVSSLSEWLVEVLKTTKICSCL